MQRAFAFSAFRNAARTVGARRKEKCATTTATSWSRAFLLATGRDGDGDVVEGAAASGRSRGPELVEGERAAVGDVVEPPAQRLRAGGGLTRRAG